MKVVFLSNFFNHHQESIALNFDKLTNHQFYFIATAKIHPQRIALGYLDMNGKYPWIIRAYESKESLQKSMQLINEADVVIIGSAPEFLIKQRLKEKKLIFRYSERVYKKKCKWYELPARAVKYFFKHTRHKNLYMLSASAYTAADYAKTFTFLNKCYKWAYFTEVKNYENIDTVIQQKEKNSILWVARLIELKHPEDSIYVVKRLKEEGYDIQLNLIGTGVLEQNLNLLIGKENLQDCIHLLGPMSPEQVRKHMEKSEIFLFNSDRNEGWGAVINESMNSACAIVASHIVGCVPFLIKDNENGLIYRDGDIEDLYKKVKYLLDNPDIRIKMGKKAYETMTTQWNAENATKRFLELSQTILDGKKKPNLFTDGVCSRAKNLKDNWY